MGKFIKIALIGGVVTLAVMTVFFGVKYSDGFTKENGVPGPTVEALGHTWNTTLIVNDDPEHSTYAVHAIFEAPESFDPKNPVITGRILRDLCDVVVANLEAFDQGGLIFDKVHHVDLNLRIEKHKAFPFDASVLLKDGACSDSVYFAESDREEMKTASNHDPNEEAQAIFASWGTVWSGVKYSTSNKGRIIEAQYTAGPEYKREINEFNFRALCIRALMDMSEKVNLFVTEIDPSSYDKLELKLIASQFSVGGLVNSSRSGSVTFELNNGKCGEAVKS